MRENPDEAARVGAINAERNALRTADEAKRGRLRSHSGDAVSAEVYQAALDRIAELECELAERDKLIASL